jgi:integrase
MNAFCRWLHDQGELTAPVKLAPQRLEKRIIGTHADAALRAMVTYRPKTFAHWRVYALVSTILDTGCRIEELLNARVTATALPESGAFLHTIGRVLLPPTWPMSA